MKLGVRDKVLFLVGTLFVSASGLYAQAFTPPKGAGNFFQSASYSFGRAHLGGLGQAFQIGHTDSIDINAGFSYGITNRLAVTGSVPFVQSRFVRPPGFPLSPHDLLSDVDDGAWYGGFQDYRIAARYNIAREPISITPFFEFAAPARDYQTFGHAIPGRGLREYRFGFSSATLLTPILPRAFAEFGYAYTHSEKLEGIRPSRSNINIELGYFLNRSLVVFGSGGWQKSHDGVEFPVPHVFRLFLFHDQLARAHFANAGGGVSFSASPTVDMYISVTSTLTGKNIDRSTTVTVGTSYNFTRFPLLTVFSEAGQKARIATLRAR